MQLNGTEPISILRAAERFRMIKLFAASPMVGRNEAIHFGHNSNRCNRFRIRFCSSEKCRCRSPLYSLTQRLLCLGKSAHAARAQNFGARRGKDVE